ncbi:hypothetical protein [Mycolicibacterium sphagni]|uniref:hypothetical protein n=1 Tax=Mycolicibacterium sphagni TaxID=1786 RepID=UPI0021F29F16|nr:hypothetical protein [Mycolicibacterium sphagni]MCV7174767.1 hypothetical protein [Mycolicibacterium sphagni]
MPDTLSPAGTFVGASVSSLVLARGGGADCGDIAVVLELPPEDPDGPVRRVFYRADPDEARRIAADLVEFADMIDPP